MLKLGCYLFFGADLTAASRGVPMTAWLRTSAAAASSSSSFSLSWGRRIRLFTVVDVFTREALATEVDTSLPGGRVVRVLEQLVLEHSAPDEIVRDNGVWRWFFGPDRPFVVEQIARYAD
jgi:transposase InsO family protein